MQRDALLTRQTLCPSAPCEQFRHESLSLERVVYARYDVCVAFANALEDFEDSNTFLLSPIHEDGVH